MRAKQCVQERVAGVDLGFSPYEKPRGYWFRRLRERQWEIVAITCSIKYGRLELDLACGIFPDWSGAYGSHIAYTGKSFNALRFGASTYPMDQAGYSFPPSMEGLCQGLEVALSDFRRLALPFFDSMLAYRARHPMLSAGHRWLAENATTLPASVFEDLQNDQAKNGPYGLTNSFYLSLRETLAKEARLAGVSKDDRQDGPLLARHLLEYWSHFRGTGWDHVGA